MNVRKIYLLGCLCVCLSVCSGCSLYEWVVDTIRSVTSSSYSYSVSVIEMRPVMGPNDLFLVDSKLAKQITEGMREGVKSASKVRELRYIQLVDNIRKSDHDKFYNTIFDDACSYDDKLSYLRDVCKDRDTNIVIWGLSHGDDSNVSYIGYLYRRDLNTITVSEKRTLGTTISEREREAIVRDSVVSLLHRSINDCSITVADKDRDVAALFFDTVVKVLAVGF